MKRIALSVTIIAISAFQALCLNMPSDVPKDNYAYESIKSLVDRGINVSQGYPDGTYHGYNSTTRYQIAYLMAKLAISLKGTVPTTEIDVSDIKEEISNLRAEVQEVKNMPELKSDFRYYGSVDFLSRLGGVLAYETDNRVKLGPETLFRFKYTVEKQIGNDAFFKMNLDTMDRGFNSASGSDLTTKLLDFEGDITTDLGMEKPVKITALFGPGSVAHRDTSGVDISDDYTYFSRPRPSLKAATKMGDYGVSVGYMARGVSNFGNVATNEVNLQLSRNYGLPWMGTTEVISVTRYMFVDFMTPSFDQDDLREELSFAWKAGEGVAQKATFGFSGTDTPRSNLYFGYELHLACENDYADILLNSVGSTYRFPFEINELLPLNLFDRKITDNSMDIGLRIGHGISKDLTLISKTEYVMNGGWKMGKDLPGTSFTQELSLEYSISKYMTMRTFYRYYYVPSRIAQFGIPVPEVSDLIGIGLTYSF